MQGTCRLKLKALESLAEGFPGVLCFNCDVVLFSSVQGNDSEASTAFTSSCKMTAMSSSAKLKESKAAG